MKCTALSCRFLLSILGFAFLTACASTPKNSAKNSPAFKRRMDHSAAQAVQVLKRRKATSKNHSRRPSSDWEEEIRKENADGEHLKTQAAPAIETKKNKESVHRLPTTILKPKTEDAEKIPEEPEPEFLTKPVLKDPGHSELYKFDQGMAYFQNRRYELAALSFQNFLDAHSDHPKADEASYWMSRCYQLIGDHGLAIVRSNQFQARYPSSQRVPEAMYFRAISHMELGQLEEAVPELKAVLETYPSSPMALEASKKLAELKVERNIK